MSDIVLMSKPYFDFGSTTAFNPASLSIVSEISPPVKAKPSDAFDLQSHSKAMAKIASLERTIERLNLSHASVLKDLYAEVENLQNTVSDLTLKKSVKMSCNDLSTRKVDIAESKGPLPPANNESHESIYILLQEQKNKYKGMIDRLFQDNKRKTNSIELLKNQLDLIKRALSLAGLELDMKELQSLVSNRVKEKTDHQTVEEKSTMGNKPEVTELVPKPPLEYDPEKTNFSLSVEPNQAKKAATLEDTQNLITKSYIERVLSINRESAPENISKKDHVIKANKSTKEAPKISLNFQETIQEVSSTAEPQKSIFNQKEPLPPIHIDDKEANELQITTKELQQKNSAALDMEKQLEAFETVSLNRWKNDDDDAMATDNQSILEILNRHRSIITDKAERKQKLREKKSRGF